MLKEGEDTGKHSLTPSNMEIKVSPPNIYKNVIILWLLKQLIGQKENCSMRFENALSCGASMSLFGLNELYDNEA